MEYKNKTNETCITKQKQRHRHREQTGSCQREWIGRGEEYVREG